MNNPSPLWLPLYTLTPAIARALMEIEAACAVIEHTPLTPAAEAELRRIARIRSTHYSTRIEGNRLTLAEAQQVIEGETVQFHGRERYVGEVKNYWNALLCVEEWAAKKMPFTEELIQGLHALIEKGTRAKPTPYRDGQNVIHDSASDAIVYLPPEYKDVPMHMAALVEWANNAEKEGLPAPLIAGLVHYQFVTIHPYYEGNGRTARLLATFILHRGGYGLNGFFSLEEHHARDIEGYYRSLAVHPHHNYYEGRSDADLTPWLEYFIKTEQVAASQVVAALGLSEIMERLLLRTWLIGGWFVIANKSNEKRTYGLSEIHRQYIDSLSAIHEGEHHGVNKVSEKNDTSKYKFNILNMHFRY